MLIVSPTRLRLSSLSGTYDFLPKDVVSLERYGLIPFVSSDIRVAHVRRDYPAKIIFWCFTEPEIVKESREIGFSPTALANSRPERREFPILVIFAILVFAHAI